jgi:hypothetical protein
VYRESDAVTRSLRDYLADDIGEVLVDDDATFATAQEYMTRFMPPEAQKRLKRYTDDIPLFTRFQIESQIESAYGHKVDLPSGGSIVIDYTEALVSVDINSARATRGSDIETTATNTNLEARTKLPVSFASVTSAASSSSTSSTWSRRRISVTSRIACAMPSRWTARASRSGACRASDCWKCPGSDCAPRWANRATWFAPAAPASAASAQSSP